jgi:hypothetical protein
MISISDLFEISTLTTWPTALPGVKKISKPKKTIKQLSKEKPKTPKKEKILSNNTVGRINYDNIQSDV